MNIHKTRKEVTIVKLKVTHAHFESLHTFISVLKKQLVISLFMIYTISMGVSVSEEFYEYKTRKEFVSETESDNC
jgi:hypothetical protein